MYSDLLWQTPEMDGQRPNGFGWGGGGPLMQQYLAAGNPALGTDAWRDLRAQGQHPFMDWLRANRPQPGNQGFAPGEYNPNGPRPMGPVPQPSYAGGGMGGPSFGGGLSSLYDAQRRPGGPNPVIAQRRPGNPYAPR